jgi:energy-coupling factor transporter ATP-binding protein EcfA2
MMWPETQQKAVARLMNDYGMKLRSNGQWLQGGLCPACNKKELYANAENPWRVMCGRINHCGYTAELKDLHPDLFAQWSKRYPQTTSNPNAAADAYLSEGRGLDHQKLRGHYSQESYYNPSKGHSATTIRFAVADGWWERLLDHHGDMPKARMKPGWSVGGNWWTPPNTHLAYQKEIWITEGIFDALALFENGLTAVSAMSVNQYPERALAELAKACENLKLPRPTLIWALDTGKAGEEYTEKFVKRAEQSGWTCKAAQPPTTDKKLDWNDLHQQKRLSNKDLERYRYYGDLLLAKTAKAKSLLIYEHEDQTNFPFRFKNRLYWCKVDIEKYHKALNQLDDTPEHLSDDETRDIEQKKRLEAVSSCMSVNEIANCYPEPLYYQYNETLDEAWYYFRINFPKGRPIKNTFTGGQLSVAAEFKKRLLAIAPGVIYEGSSSQLDRFLKNSIEDIKRVETIDYVGYSKKHSAYIFNKLAFQNGRVFTLNADDYFELPKQTNLKSLMAGSLKLNIADQPPEQPVSWVNELFDAWGAKGLLALSGFMGSLFAEQIRAKHKSYHFLELTGEPGAGKSTLITFMWRLMGRDDHEGTDPNKGSVSGLRRSMSQISNMPITLVESDRENNGKASQFDWNTLKNLYDGGSLGTRGNKNNGNDTVEPMFKGTIVISQNAEVISSEAIMSRICQIFFYTNEQTRLSESSARRIEQLSTEDLSHFTYKLLALENKFLEVYFQQKPIYEENLKDSGIKTFRVAFNHAQLMAIFEALAATVLPELNVYRDIVLGTIVQMAQSRDRLIRTDSPLVMQFWDIVERIDSTNNLVTKTSELNHSNEDRLFAINFAHLYQVAKQQYFELPPINDIQHALRQSRRYKFKAANQSIRSKIEKRSVRCWIFERPHESVSSHHP